MGLRGWEDALSLNGWDSPQFFQRSVENLAKISKFPFEKMQLKCLQNCTQFCCLNITVSKNVLIAFKIISFQKYLPRLWRCGERWEGDRSLVPSWSTDRLATRLPRLDLRISWPPGRRHWARELQHLCRGVLGRSQHGLVATKQLFVQISSSNGEYTTNWHGSKCVTGLCKDCKN